MPSDSKKGITVKIDEELHAETDDIQYESGEEEAINGQELDNEETEYENAEVYRGM